MPQPNDPSSFFRIRTGTLRGDLPIGFDLYLSVAEKFLLYCKKGDSFEGERLDRLIQKKVERLYVKNEDIPKYQRYLNQNIERAFNTSEDLSIELKAEIVEGYLEASIQDLAEDLNDRPLYRVLKEAASKLQLFIGSHPLALKSILQLKNPNESVLQHSVNVAAFALEIAKEMGITEGDSRDLLLLGAFLHDIEFLQNTTTTTTTTTNDQIINSAPDQTSSEFYQRHPIRGAESLRRAEFFEPEVIEIVQNHHEAADGSGFPDKKTEKKLSVPCQIVSTANAFDALLSFQRMTIKEALRHFLIEGMGVHPLNVLQALQKVIKKHRLI